MDFIVAMDAVLIVFGFIHLIFQFIIWFRVDDIADDVDDIERDIDDMSEIKDE